MPRHIAIVALLILAALNLAPSVAHVMEAPPRLWVWPMELWREATVFHGQFAVFAPVGAVLEIATILGTGGFAWAWRRERVVIRPALVAALLFAAGLAAWFAVVAPANAILATWVPGPLAPGADALRLRWETGHALIATVKLAAFAALAMAGLRASEATAAKGV